MADETTASKWWLISELWPNLGKESKRLEKTRLMAKLSGPTEEEDEKGIGSSRI